jgi:Flp pilus assembly protein TadD
MTTAPSPATAAELEAAARQAIQSNDHRRIVLALDAYLQAVPDTPSAWYAKGMAHLHLGELEEGARSFTRVLDLDPRHFPSLHYLGAAHLDNDRPELALAAFDKALALNPQSRETLYNRAKALGALGRTEEEIQVYQLLARLKPDAAVHLNMGVAYRELHRHEDSLKQFRQALQIDPDNVLARCNRALTNLLLGNYEHGWREYEWRWRDGTERHGVQGRLWLGDADLSGKTILLHSEQGLGDTLQFVRFARHVCERGAQVILQVQRPVLDFVKTLKGYTGSILPRDQAVTDFDFHCPLLSLPLALKLTVDDLPGPMPYLDADPARVACWQKRLGPPTRPRVGLVWGVSLANKKGLHRSMPLAALRPLMDLDIEFVSLQKELSDVDRRDMAAMPALRELGSGLADFADTAALVRNLDLVICVDTSVTHVAGAMGLPAWVLVPFNSDWRWMAERDDSPWYPSVRVFREPAPGNWAPLVQAVRQALSDRYASRMQ